MKFRSMAEKEEDFLFGEPTHYEMWLESTKDNIKFGWDNSPIGSMFRCVNALIKWLNR